MIQKLLENKKKFFWSKTVEGNITVGGYGIGARYYGEIVFSLSEDKANMEIYIIKGPKVSDQLTERKEFIREIDQLEYSYVKNLFEEIGDYLELEGTTINQDLNREDLMKNLHDFLLTYPN